MYVAQTTVSLEGTKIFINGQPTYSGTSVEGLLFNIRTVNATFDDTLGQVNWWDDDGSHPENDHAGYGQWQSSASASANTERFIAALPEYQAHGIVAVNLNFQGGHPLNGKPEIAAGHGSAGRRPNGHRDFYHNSGFLSDGSIDEPYRKHISAVIEACDRLSMVVILQLFYFGQDTVFSSEAAICAATDNAVDFVCSMGYRNVIIEIANEVMAGHFHHEILKPTRAAELIHRVRARATDRHSQRLLVTTSEAALLNSRQWTTEQIDAVFSASDLILIHGGDNIETGRVGDASELVEKVEFLQSRPWYRRASRPIITNESQGEQALDALVRRGISFGLHSIIFQTMFPPKWGIWENETTWFFRKVKGLTQPTNSDR
ncbi:MAG: hypothetical protein O7E52_24990 [Candidatus Poribacteria bacterium]|nr:hypothetical protein [Candidatus Poribacteria bacterium]